MKKHYEPRYLLQNGTHLGKIVEDEYDCLSEESRFVISFLGSNVSLPYSLSHLNQKDRLELNSLLFPNPGEGYVKINGRTIPFEIELKIVNTTRGPVGINIIVGVVPEIDPAEKIDILTPRSLSPK